MKKFNVLFFGLALAFGLSGFVKPCSGGKCIFDSVEVDQSVEDKVAEVSNDDLVVSEEEDDLDVLEVGEDELEELIADGLVSEDEVEEESAE